MTPGGIGSGRGGEEEYVRPAGERREGFRVFPDKVDRRRRNTVKNWFEIFDIKILAKENF